MLTSVVAVQKFMIRYALISYNFYVYHIFDQMFIMRLACFEQDLA